MIRQYIGARYVMKVYENTQTPGSAEWESGKTYEPLTLVTYGYSSYLSKKEVPANIGDPANNPSYWVTTGSYNGQIANLQNQIDAIHALYVTPEMYGAVGDGVTDDYQAIMDAIANRDGRPVLFQNKTYAIGTALNIPGDLTLLGSNTIIKNLDANINHSSIWVNNADNIIIVGIEIDNNAPTMNTTTTNMWNSAVLQISKCNNCTIESVKVHGLRRGQSGIMIQGDHNKVRNCEVYSGSGNRQNAGIITGSATVPNLPSNGGSQYTEISGCYVHDISTGTSADESGYGIYFMASKNCECFNNLVVDCNWVGICCQTEQGLNDTEYISVHDNTIIIDNPDVYPRQDYWGPYNIYLEDAKNCEIFDNVMVCGNCTSNKYVAFTVSENCGICNAHGNRFVQGSVLNLLSLLSNGSELIYTDNVCEFSVNRFMFAYNDATLKFKAANCSINCVNDVIVIDKGAQADVAGYIDLESCNITSSNGKLYNANNNLSISFKMTECSFIGVGCMLDYNNGDSIIRNNVIDSSTDSAITIRYGSGSKKIEGNTIKSGIRAVLLYDGTAAFDDVIIKDNKIEAGLYVINTSDTNAKKLIISDNIMVNTNASNVAINIANPNTSVPELVIKDNYIKANGAGVTIYNTSNVGLGFVCDNAAKGSASIGVSTSANIMVENNHCVA